LYGLKGVGEVMRDGTEAGRARIGSLRVASSGAAIAGLSTESLLAVSSGTSVPLLSTESNLLHLAMKLRNDRG
jgi:hypothetical protein